MHLDMKNLKKEKIIIESQKGSMDKFFISNKQNITQNLDENITNEQCGDRSINGPVGFGVDSGL